MRFPRACGTISSVKHKTWTTVDKTTWGSGPWLAEPDKEQWADEATGYPCLLKRSPLGALCGYVGVPEGHPWHGADYDAVEPYPDVHGGLTYASLCQEGPEDETICHVPAPGEPEPLWWLGFDCAHSGDLMPAERHYFDGELYGTYQTAQYVKDQCARLAAQATAACQP